MLNVNFFNRITPKSPKGDLLSSPLGAGVKLRKCLTKRF